MAEYTKNEIQTVQPNQNVLLNTSIPCNKGYIYHRNESGIVTLKGVVNNPNACFARYQVTFDGNIAIPEGGTASPIAVSLAIDGSPILTSEAIYTPTAAGAYGNIVSAAQVTVPRGCCFNVSVENTSPVPEGATAPAINVQNANLTISRIA